jgi:hypothetical protein
MGDDCQRGCKNRAFGAGSFNGVLFEPGTIGRHPHQRVGESPSAGGAARRGSRSPDDVRRVQRHARIAGGLARTPASNRVWLVRFPHGAKDGDAPRRARLPGPGLAPLGRSHAVIGDEIDLERPRHGASRTKTARRSVEREGRGEQPHCQRPFVGELADGWSGRLWNPRWCILENPSFGLNQIGADRWRWRQRRVAAALSMMAFISRTAAGNPSNRARAMMECPMLSSRMPGSAATATTL